MVAVVQIQSRSIEPLTSSDKTFYVDSFFKWKTLLNWHMVIGLWNVYVCVTWGQGDTCGRVIRFKIGIAMMMGVHTPLRKWIDFVPSLIEINNWHWLSKGKCTWSTYSWPFNWSTTTPVPRNPKKFDDSDTQNGQIFDHFGIVGTLILNHDSFDDFDAEILVFLPFCRLWVWNLSLVVYCHISTLGVTTQSLLNLSRGVALSNSEIPFLPLTNTIPKYPCIASAANCQKLVAFTDT